MKKQWPLAMIGISKGWIISSLTAVIDGLCSVPCWSEIRSSSIQDLYLEQDMVLTPLLKLSSVINWSNLKAPPYALLMPSQVDFSPVFHINFYHPGRKVGNKEVFNGWVYFSWCVKVFCGSDREVWLSWVPFELCCLPLNKRHNEKKKRFFEELKVLRK